MDSRRKPIQKFSHAPLSQEGIRTTLSRVYFTLIGVLSESERGIKMFQSENMFAFLFQLTRKEITQSKQKNIKERTVAPNDTLIRLLAMNLDYTHDQNVRMLFSHWIAQGSFFLRKTLIQHLELLYRAQMPRFDEWFVSIFVIFCFFFGMFIAKLRNCEN